MFTNDKRIIKSLFLFLVCVTALLFTASGQKKFTVVIDPGHGGKDPGAIGLTSKEKDINLAVALKLGENIKKKNPDVDVLYTRKSDVYLTVGDRPKYANDVHADLFVSIHANSSKNTTASGTETFTLGVAKTQENLEVAMLENSVILLEDNYEQKYQGFDPNSIESYIMFEFMQDKYLEQSVHLASLVQKQFGSTCDRRDRGVKQAGFLVLKNTAMPSILVELGFISNPDEEKYMSSENGQKQLASALYNAFSVFKAEYDRKSTKNGIKNNTPEVNNTTDKTVKKNETTGEKIYKVQIHTSRELIKADDPRFKGLNNVAYYRDGDIYKYTYGETTDNMEALKFQKEARRYFNGAFIVVFQNGKRIK